jgi:hypothetical protein
MAAISSRAVSAGVSCRFPGPHSISFELAAGLAGGRAGTLVVPVREHRLSPLGAWRGGDVEPGELRTALLQCRTSWSRLSDFSRQAWLSLVGQCVAKYVASSDGGLLPGSRASGIARVSWFRCSGLVAVTKGGT